MRFAAYSSLLLLCGALAAGGFVQEQTQEDTWPPHVKASIESQLELANKNSILVFDKNGNHPTEIPVLQEWRQFSRSLKDYVNHISNANRNAYSSNRELGPIASCEEPKALKPPPPCVLCKDGRIICSKAAFGKAAKSGAPDQ